MTRFGFCIIEGRNLCEWAEEVEYKNSSRCYKLTIMEQRDIDGQCRDMKEWG